MGHTLHLKTMSEKYHSYPLTKSLPYTMNNDIMLVKTYYKVTGVQKNMSLYPNIEIIDGISKLSAKSDEVSNSRASSVIYTTNHIYYSIQDKRVTTIVSVS